MVGMLLSNLVTVAVGVASSSGWIDGSKTATVGSTIVPMLSLSLGVEGVGLDFAPTATIVRCIENRQTPVILLDNVLPKAASVSLRGGFRSRTDCFERHGNDVSFPGAIAKTFFTYHGPEQMGVLYRLLRHSPMVVEHYLSEFVFPQTCRHQGVKLR
jgi:hypothetical protein